MASQSPGFAPRTSTGPLTTCGPEPCGWSDSAAMAAASARMSDAATPCAWKNPSGSLPCSSSRPSWLSVSMRSVSPALMAATGRSPRAGRVPHRTVSGWLGRWMMLIVRPSLASLASLA